MQEIDKIPKIIHYCWFGYNDFDDLTLKCMKSWKRYCPEYEIKEWNEENFFIEENTYVKEAYQMKKWAFVSDYVRLKVLYEYGGIYMDTDVEVLKSLDSLLSYRAFVGFEAKDRISTATIGTCKKNPWIKELLDYYKNRRFILENGEMDMTTNVKIITKLTKNIFNFQLNNKFQIIENKIVFFPVEYLSASLKVTKNTYAVHHFSGSWLSEYEKKLKRYYLELRKYIGPVLAGKIVGCLSIYNRDGLIGVVKRIKESFLE